MQVIYLNFTLIKGLIFDVVEYIRLKDNDCLFGNNIGSLIPPQRLPFKIYDDCDTWCQDHRNCAGYTIFDGACYFKNKGCKNDLFKDGAKSTFLLLGKHLAFNQIFRFGHVASAMNLSKCKLSLLILTISSSDRQHHFRYVFMGQDHRHSF